MHERNWARSVVDSWRPRLQPTQAPPSWIYSISVSMSLCKLGDWWWMKKHSVTQSEMVQVRRDEGVTELDTHCQLPGISVNGAGIIIINMSIDSQYMLKSIWLYKEDLYYKKKYRRPMLRTSDLSIPQTSYRQLLHLALSATKWWATHHSPTAFKGDLLEPEALCDIYLWTETLLHESVVCLVFYSDCYLKHFPKWPTLH